MTEILTFGHGTASAADITRMLRAGGVRLLVDVRSYPTSRHNPHVCREEMAGWLPAAGVEYLWEPRLGGRRKAVLSTPVDLAIRNESFRNYAEWMRSDTFRAGVDALLEIATDRCTAVMCSETVWWRCHRKMLADYLVAVCGVQVRHIMHNGRVPQHRPMVEARRTHVGLVYDVGTTGALFAADLVTAASGGWSR